MGEIGFGVIGLGMGYSHARTAHGMGVLKAVADISEARGQKAKTELGTDWYADVAEMLKRDDIQAVFVAVPSGMHLDMGLKCIEAGKHVIIEKPLEITPERCNQLIDAAQRKGVKLAVNFQNRFSADVRKARKAVQEGALGRLLLGEARLKWYRSQDYYSGGGWRGTWKMDGGGSLMNQSVHYIDLLQWICGKVAAVRGQYKILNHQIETEDCGMGMVTFENGAAGTILGTTCCYPDQGTFIELHGEKGSIQIKDNKIVWAGIMGVDDAQAYLEQFADPGPGSSIADMTAAINEGRDPHTTGVDARHAVEIITAIYESSRQNGAEVQVQGAAARKSA